MMEEGREMNYISKSLIILGVLGAASSANAYLIDRFCPMVGIDYYQVWSRPKDDYSKIFPQSFPGATYYIGAKFLDYFGIEIGYDGSAKKSKRWNLLSGQSFMNVPVSNNFSGSSSVRRTGGHIDIIGYLPIIEKLDYFVTIGYGWVQTKIEEINMNVIPGSVRHSSAIASLSGKGQSILRVGLGANYMVNNCVGLKAKLGYEKSSSLRVNGNAEAVALNYGSKLYRASGTLSVGAFIKF
jgi:hypothetical protein